MKIRHISIENFRGIRELSWTVPSDRSFFVLVGPGDATKSTVLTAIERGLSGRWNIAFRDTDFHNGNIDSPIRIRITVGDLPDDLMALDAFGSYLCGIYRDGELTHDPQDDNEACVVIELRVESDLEPQWLAYRPGDTELHTVKASLRSQFGSYRVDERVDAHLRWSRMSALGKLTEARHGTKQTLTEASRAAQRAVTESVSPDLKALAGEIQDQMKQLGSADFQDLKPGLDMSLTNAQGNLALFDGPVPLTNFGLGTRRLAGAAAQQLAHQGSALLLVDEVEYGLEPHRLVHLLSRLRDKDAYAQVFVTTHSPTALQHLDAADLVMVRSAGGSTLMRSLEKPESLKSVIRSSPEAFLSRRVIIGEGKTEYGLILAKLHEWDTAPCEESHLPSSALGVVSVEGKGSETAEMALSLLLVGYEVTVLMDSDDQAANARVEDIEAAGGIVVQWADDLNTEAAICAQLDDSGLTRLIKLAIDVSDDPDSAKQSVYSHLTNQGAPKTTAQADVASWIEAGFDLARARVVVSLAAHKKGWFKNVNKGKRLVEFINSIPEFTSGPIADSFSKLRSAIYEPRPNMIRSAETIEKANDAVDPADMPELAATTPVSQGNGVEPIL